MWPEWWDWELAFTGHVERRMEERGFGEVEHRFMIHTAHRGQPWVVIVEPDAAERRLVVVTAYEVWP